jgi:acyl-CoA dehydrogenase
MNLLSEYLPSGVEATPEREQMQRAIKSICDEFDDEYWRKKEAAKQFPHDFHTVIARGGWLGLTMPEEWGGSGLGVSDAALMMQTVANSAGAISACSSFHINLFGPHPLVVYGTQEQKARFIPNLVEGKDKVAFGVTEPDAGLDTTSITTQAVRAGDTYVVNGRKIWTTTAQQATKLFLLTRTTPLKACKKRTDGMTLFYTEFDRDRIEVHEIDKIGRNAVNSNAIFIDNLVVPVTDRIGEEGNGFRMLLDSLNPERILVAAECVGVGRRALAHAVRYSNERIVFDRPIGKNQAIQHPLAQSWMALEAADLMVWHAARLYDEGKACGAQANTAKYLAADAAFDACDRAMRTHGGYGYAKEYNVERYLREIMLPRIAPISREMIMNYISEHVLGLPKSY